MTFRFNAFMYLSLVQSEVNVFPGLCAAYSFCVPAYVLIVDTDLFTRNMFI
jgi:hypothetical protein